MPTRIRKGRASLPLFVLMSGLLVSACRSGSAPTAGVEVEVDAGDENDASAAPPPGFVALELKNEPVDEVLQKLATAAGKAFVIDPDAQAAAHCARITLFTGGNMPADKALELVREVLETSGFSLATSGTGGIVVRRDPDKPLPATCQSSPDPDPAPAPSGTADELAVKFAAGVRKISDTEYEISRASMDLLTGNQSMILRLARMVPQHRDGKAVGVRLFGIRAKSALSTLGLKNGDTVTSVAGHSVTSPDEALAAYSDLKNAKSFDITLERRGQVAKITYRLKEK
jgi:hypothetical protein